MLASLLAHSEQAIIKLHILTDEDTKPWEVDKAEHPSCPPQRQAQSPSSSSDPGGKGI